MWISRYKWQRTQERIDELEEKVRNLQKGPRVYFNGGTVECWEGGHFTLDQALNAMAKHLGFRWEVQPEVQAIVEVRSTQGKKNDP